MHSWENFTNLIHSIQITTQVDPICMKYSLYHEKSQSFNLTVAKSLHIQGLGQWWCKCDSGEKNSSQTGWWNYWAVGLFHVTQLHTCQGEIPLYSAEACDPFWPSNMCGRGFIFQQDIDPEHAWKWLCTGPVWCPGKSQQCWPVWFSPLQSLCWRKLGKVQRLKEEMVTSQVTDLGYCQRVASPKWQNLHIFTCFCGGVQPCRYFWLNPSLLEMLEIFVSFHIIFLFESSSAKNVASVLCRS